MDVLTDMYRKRPTKSAVDNSNPSMTISHSSRERLTSDQRQKTRNIARRQSSHINNSDSDSDTESTDNSDKAVQGLVQQNNNTFTGKQCQLCFKKGHEARDCYSGMKYVKSILSPGNAAYRNLSSRRPPMRPDNRPSLPPNSSNEDKFQNREHNQNQKQWSVPPTQSSVKTTTSGAEWSSGQQSNSWQLSQPDGAIATTHATDIASPRGSLVKPNVKTDKDQLNLENYTDCLNSELTDACGTPLTEWGKAQFDIELNNVKFKQEIIVAQIEDEGLLGMDILQNSDKGPADILQDDVLVTTTEELTGRYSLVMQDAVVGYAEPFEIIATLIDAEDKTDKEEAVQKNERPSSKDMENKSPETRHYWMNWESLLMKNETYYSESLRRKMTGEKGLLSNKTPFSRIETAISVSVSV
ncbi:hypothetical protein KUTeg_009318 [Tegillarca granosa]|uniref:CCHC-type domain-containing protein n=1 Tax=Tegillarca granosa TaxID=220873 RepID=A0ABQ9F6X5_TEGGR|nr:hypothetical protein KUTeg_009318 [Tegillarca granosa]